MTRVEIHKQLCDGLNELYAAKNADYNNSFANLRDKFGDTAILIRLNDKLSRLEQLMKPGYEAKVQDEKIEDTLTDLANYSLMELTERQYEQERDALTNMAMDQVQALHNLPDTMMYHPSWQVIYAITEDGTERTSGNETEMDDLTVFCDPDSGTYHLYIETIYHWDDTGDLTAWLNKLLTKFGMFVTSREQNIPYELDYSDNCSVFNGIHGKSLTEVFTKFAFYVKSIRAWYEGIKC